MMTSVKAPREVQELFFEARACHRLAIEHDGWWPGDIVKAIYYGAKAEKASSFAWRALQSAHPEISNAAWSYDSTTGIATKDVDPDAPIVKKPRKPRVKKVVAAAPQEGDKS